MQASALTAWELFCRRGDRLLFGSLDIWVEAGGAVYLVGPNGIGKSSLLQILAGLRTSSPADRLRGPDVKRGSVAWRGCLGLLDAHCTLDEVLPLENALAFWARIDGAARADQNAAMVRMGLSSLGDVPVRYLSTGQRKRAGFARLLIQNADHWLLDEPLNGLDIDGVALVEELIAERRAAGGAIVVASHQPIALPDAQAIDLRDHPW